MPEREPAVAVEGLRRDYGDRTALRDVGFELDAGETLVVLGPNGAGKTTLLRILATLLRPHAGEVRVLGCALPREGWRLRGRLGYLGHEPLLYRELTGRENLRLHARLHRIDREEAERRIADLLERVGMSRRADERVAELSAGMAQRLAVAKAVLHEPGLLVLDEPGTNLDPEAERMVEPLTGAGSGRTRVLATHDARRALDGDGQALALTRHGEVAYHGPAGSLDESELRRVYGGPA